MDMSMGLIATSLQLVRGLLEAMRLMKTGDSYLFTVRGSRP